MLAAKLMASEYGWFANLQPPTHADAQRIAHHSPSTPIVSSLLTIAIKIPPYTLIFEHDNIFLIFSTADLNTHKNPNSGDYNR